MQPVAVLVAVAVRLGVAVALAVAVAVAAAEVAADTTVTDPDDAVPPLSPPQPATSAAVPAPANHFSARGGAPSSFP